MAGEHSFESMVHQYQLAHRWEREERPEGDFVLPSASLALEGINIHAGIQQLPHRPFHIYKAKIAKARDGESAQPAVRN
jgi:hypothetical protein